MLNRLELGVAPRLSETHQKTRQSPRLCARSDKFAGSGMRSGSNPPKHKLEPPGFADALAAQTPEEKKARARVEARKRRNKKQDPEEGKEGKKDEFIIGPTFDATGRELTFLVAAALREIGKQDIEGLTKADEAMLLPLAQKMGGNVDRVKES